MDRLSTFTPAPLFNLEDVYGRQIDLSKYRGKKTLIGFYRHAGCPFCNMRVHTLTKTYADLKSKLEMIFFFESRKEVILRSSFHQDISPVPIISDPTREIYSKYGIERSTWKSTKSHMLTFIQTAIKAKTHGLPLHLMADDESFSTMPAEFLLDENLMIKHLHYSEDLNTRIKTDDLYGFANSNLYSEI